MHFQAITEFKNRNLWIYIFWKYFTQRGQFEKKNCFINMKYLTQNFLKNIIIRVLLIIYMFV